MIAATLFSGIGAPETAMPSWDWRWSAEIERFPSAVLAARHPQSVNLGDVTADDFIERAEAIGRPDILVFGSPCQSFSVAGRRLGLDDPRGNLALVALGIVARLKPTWFVFENVPGLLSASEGRDFGLFLRTVDELGYSCGWSVLDAQYFGLAQRRQRVFVVGHLGTDWQYPAAVLLEPESLCGHPPTRGEAGERAAHSVVPSLTGSGRGVERAGEGRGQDPLVVAGTVGRHHSNGARGYNDPTNATLVPEVCGAVSSKWAKGSGGPAGDEAYNLVPVAHALRADGFDASEDGTGRGTPLVAVADLNQVTSKANRSQPTPELSHTLPATGNSPIAFGWQNSASQGDSASEDVTPTLDKSKTPAVAYQCQGTNVGEMGTLRAGNGNETGGVPFVSTDAEWYNTPYHAEKTEASAIQALRVLFSRVDQEALVQWCLGILAPLWPEEVLRPDVHGGRLRREGISFGGLVYIALSREKESPEGVMRTLWHAASVGCSPQGWELPEQQALELAACLSELPYASAPAEAFLRLVWQASEGLGLLRQALSAAQKARRSACGQDADQKDMLGMQPASERARIVRPTLHAGQAVRRLTVAECEALQGFPRSYTLIIYRGKPAADGPRYKAIGNSMAVPVIRWILERIDTLERWKRSQEAVA